MTTNTTHPDFTPAGHKLSNVQFAWLIANGIDATANRDWHDAPGFYFVKGDLAVYPVHADAESVEIVRDLGTDRERTAKSFPRLRDALKWLAAQ